MTISQGDDIGLYGRRGKCSSTIPDGLYDARTCVRLPWARNTSTFFSSKELDGEHSDFLYTQTQIHSITSHYSLCRVINLYSVQLVLGKEEKKQGVC